MDESDERIDVDDLVDVWDLHGAEQVEDGLDPSRLESLSRALGGRLRRHRAGIAAAAAVIVLGAGAVGIWKATHPYRFPVPDITVTVSGRTAVPAEANPSGEPNDAVVALELDVTAPAADGVQVTFEDVSGTGISTQVSAPVPVHGSAHVSAVPTVDCSTWSGPQSLLAHFRVDDGTTTRDLTVPVGIAAGAPHAADAAVAVACREYYATNPLSVTALAAVADPVQPVLHLTWTLHNASNDVWTVNGQGSSADTTYALLPGEVTSKDLPALGSAEVSSTLRVQSCATDIVPDEGTIQLDLSASRGDVDQTSATASSNDLRAVLSAAADACRGAPQVAVLPTSVRLTGTGTPRAGTIAVQAQISSPGSWTAALDQPLWWTQDQSGAFEPLVTRSVRGPGQVAMSLTYRPSPCLGVGQDATLVMSVQGDGRVYPYTVPVETPAAWTCPAGTG